MNDDNDSDDEQEAGGGGGGGQLAPAYQLFLQAMMSHRLLPVAQAQTLLDAACLIAEHPQEPLETAKEAINQPLESLDMALASGPCDDTGMEYLALINKTKDDLSKLATDFKEVEIAFVNYLLDAIVAAREDNFQVSSTTALNSKLLKERKLSRTRAEEIISQLLTDGWLRKCGQGKLTFGVRMYLELDFYLRQQFPDSIDKCFTCQGILCYGERCSNASANCSTGLHVRCARNLFRNQPPKCPRCGAAWTRLDVDQDRDGDEDDEEEAEAAENPLADLEAWLEERQRQQPSQSGGSNHHRGTATRSSRRHSDEADSVASSSASADAANAAAVAATRQSKRLHH